MKKLLIAPIFSVILIAGLVSAAIAGHNYHGYSMKMSEMSEIDSNNDGEITFDEFSAPTTEKLKIGFEMLDTNSDEVAGKDPGILQGPKTDQKLLGELREKLESGDTFHGKTVNYRKDGSEFIMEWKIFPISNSEKRTTHFLAFQRAI